VITFNVRTRDHAEMVDITDEVRTRIRQSGSGKGVAQVFVPHTTAGITINESADPSVRKDILADLNRLVPWRQPYYTHREGNSASHVKASLVGSSVFVPIEDGRIVLGTWQGVFFCEFDGPRTRKVHMQILPA
jgi:secondary thiamine-phosphate synthase enzyme